jgi:hypothetical protein
MNPEARFATLRRAVLAYDRALKAYGLLGTEWVDSDALDQLWRDVLAAAEPESTTPDSLSGPN